MAEQPDNDIDTEVDTEVDDIDDQDDAPEETAEQLRERLTKMERSLNKANREAAKLRAANKPKPPAGNRTTAREGDDQADTVSALRETERWRSRTLKAEARAALAGAGAPAERLDRLARLVDIDSLDVDDDGRIVGLDDQIEELRDDFPELFRRARATREPERQPVRLSSGSRRTAASAVPEDPTLFQVRQLQGTAKRRR